MANNFAAMNVPAGSGNGAALAVADWGVEKTIVIEGAITGDLFIEASGDGVNFAPFAYFPPAAASAHKPVKVKIACTHMRVRRAFVVGGTTPVVVAGAGEGVAEAVALAVPVGAGTGATGDTSELPEFKTVFVGGLADGQMVIEATQDGSSFDPVLTIQGQANFPNQWFALEGVFQGMRVRRTLTNTGAGPFAVVTGGEDGAADNDYEGAGGVGFGMLNAYVRDTDVWTNTNSPDYIRPINQFFPDVGGPVTMTALAAANRLYATPFFVPRNCVILNLKNYYDDAGAGGSVRFGIYTNHAGGLYPIGLVWDSGQITPVSGAPFTITPAAAVNLTKGWYWFVGTIGVIGATLFSIRSEVLPDLGVESNFNGIFAGSPSNRLGWFVNHDPLTALPATFPVSAGVNPIFYAAGLHFPTMYARFNLTTP